MKDPRRAERQRKKTARKAEAASNRDPQEPKRFGAPLLMSMLGFMTHHNRRTSNKGDRFYIGGKSFTANADPDFHVQRYSPYNRRQKLAFLSQHKKRQYFRSYKKVA